MSVTVSFIIPCYRSRRFLGETLASIERLHRHVTHEIIVVDSSNDGTVEWLRREHPQVHTLQSRNRLWPGQARNRGAEQSRAEWLAFVDADAVVEPGWLETMLAALEPQGRRLVGGWVANANPQEKPSRILHWIEFSEYLPGCPSGERTRLSSSNWLMRRQTFLQSGGFTEEPVLSEDSIFCRALAEGIYFEGSSGIRHHFRDTWPEVKRHLEHLGYWGGRHRRSKGARGAHLALVPPMAYLLLPYRAVLIPLRVARADLRQGLRCILHLPWLLNGLWHWTRGFRRGVVRGAGGFSG